MKRLGVILLLLALLLSAGCGGGEEAPQATPTLSPAPSTASPTAEVTATIQPALTPGKPVATVEPLPMGKIAFSSRRDGNGEIYLLTLEGEVNLTNNPAEDGVCDISPDSTEIAFASDRDGTQHIYVMNVDGSDLRRLTGGPSGDMYPRWSPDGKQIAFSRGVSLYVMDSDGSNVRRVLEAVSDASPSSCEAGGFLGDWSSDGKQLTFYVSIATSQRQVCVVNVDGSGLRSVIGGPSGYHVEPAWSPDGEWIAFRDVHDHNGEIHIVKPDGTSVRALTDNPATDIEPDWSPDSQWVVFTSDRSGDFDLYIVKPDGSDLTRVTSTPGKDSDPSWGP